jgi:hypothetical protein
VSVCSDPGVGSVRGLGRGAALVLSLILIHERRGRILRTSPFGVSRKFAACKQRAINSKNPSIEGCAASCFALLIESKAV